MQYPNNGQYPMGQDRGGNARETDKGNPRGWIYSPYLRYKMKRKEV